MACNGCHWITTALRCCGFKIKGEQIEDTEHKQTISDNILDNERCANEDIGLKVDKPCEEFRPSLNVTSFSCPDITERNQVGGMMSDVLGEKHFICKKKPQCDQHPRLPRLSSDSNINARLSTNLATRFADSVGDRMCKNISDCETAGDGIYQNVSDSQTAGESKVTPVGINKIETSSGEGKVEKAMDSDGGDFDATEKSSAQQHSKRALPLQVSELTKLTSSGFQGSDSRKNPILVYQVLVEEMNGNFGEGAKADQNDVEMTEANDDMGNDVDMEDMSVKQGDGGAFSCGPTTQNVEMTEGNQQVKERGAETTVFQQPQCINLIGSVTYITNQHGTAYSDQVSDKISNLSEEGSADSLPQNKNGSSNKFRLPTVIWNESVRVIYFNPRRKLRKTASSKEGQQDLIAVDVWPLKDAADCNLHARLSEMEARFFTGDLHPTGLKAALEELSTQKENSDGEDSSDGSKGSSGSSSNSD